MSKANIIELLGASGPLVHEISEADQEIILETFTVSKDNFTRTIDGLLNRVPLEDHDRVRTQLDRLIAGTALYACMATKAELTKGAEPMK